MSDTTWLRLQEARVLLFYSMRDSDPPNDSFWAPFRVAALLSLYVASPMLDRS